MTSHKDSDSVEARLVHDGELASDLHGKGSDDATVLDARGDAYMDDLRWQRDPRAPALPSGSVGLNDGWLTALLLALEVRNAARARQMLEAL